MNPEFWKWSKDERYAAGYEQGMKDAEKKSPTPCQPTHKDVLLKAWAQDDHALAEERVWRNSYAYYGDFDGEVKIKRDKGGSVANLMAAQEEAIRLEIDYLNSAAEVGK